MSSFLSFLKVKLCSSYNNFTLMVNIVLKNFFKSKNFWLTVIKCKQNYTTS